MFPHPPEDERNKRKTYCTVSRGLFRVRRPHPDGPTAGSKYQMENRAAAAVVIVGCTQYIYMDPSRNTLHSTHSRVTGVCLSCV